MEKINGNIKTVCVYCGSGPGTNPHFIEAASAFGKTLAENGVRLVYGGGSIGLMGAVARGVLDNGGEGWPNWAAFVQGFQLDSPDMYWQ